MNPYPFDHDVKGNGIVSGLSRFVFIDYDLRVHVCGFGEFNNFCYVTRNGSSNRETIVILPYRTRYIVTTCLSLSRIKENNSYCCQIRYGNIIFLRIIRYETRINLLMKEVLSCQ